MLAIEILIQVALLPLSVLLLLFPAVVPDESVIADVAPRTGLLRGLFRRLFNLAVGLAALVALVVFTCELLVRVGVTSGPLAWGWSVLIIYGLDLLILLMI